MSYRTSRTAVLIGAALAGIAVAASAQMGGFEPIGDYVLKVNGELVQDAEILRSQTAGSAILVISSALPSPFVLLPRERSVELVRPELVLREPDGTASLPSDAVAGSSGGFTVLEDGSGVSCTVAGKPVELTENPWLVGFHDRQQVLEHSAGYVFLAGKYNPSQPLLRALRAGTDEVTIRVFFGSWCPACQLLMPKILKVAEALEGSKIHFEYYGLPRPFGGDGEAEKAEIRSIPTGVVLRNGTEVSRIQGNKWRIPELAIRDALSEAAGGRAGK